MTIHSEIIHKYKDKKPTMYMYYFMQPKNFMILIILLIIMNIINRIKINISMIILNKYYIDIKIISNLLYITILALLYYLKIFWFFFYISNKLKLVFKLQDEFLRFSWAFFRVLKKFAFSNLNSGFILYLINIYLNLDIISYIYKINFLISFIIILIYIIEWCDKNNRFKNKLFKFGLYLLLWLSIGMLFYIFIKMVNHVFVFIITKILNAKDLIKKSLNNNNSPNNSNFDIYYSDSINKRKKNKNKYLKQRAKEMHNKLLILQKFKAKDNKNLHKNYSLSSKRGINKYIYIEPRQDLNIETQFERIKSELEAYNIQQKKFKLWSKGKGKDFTYPDEAKKLFKEYSILLKDLRPYLKSMKKKIKKQLKK